MKQDLVHESEGGDLKQSVLEEACGRTVGVGPTDDNVVIAVDIRAKCLGEALDNCHHFRSRCEKEFEL